MDGNERVFNNLFVFIKQYVVLRKEKLFRKTFSYR